MMAVPYLEDEPTGKLTEKTREKASRSRLLKDLKAQYDDRPEEMSAEGTGYGGRDSTATKEDQKWNDREAFEEANFIRLNMTRADKRSAKRLAKKGCLMRFQNEFKVFLE